jgi:hypothetical protein
MCRQRSRKTFSHEVCSLLLLLFVFLQIRASDSTGVEKLISTLGTGDNLKTKLNSELKKQGLNEATGVTAPVKSGHSVESAAVAVSPMWAMVLAAHVLTLGLV